MQTPAPKGPSGFDRLTAVAVAALALVLSIYALVTSREDGRAPDGRAAAYSQPADFAKAAKKVMPSLVKIDNLVLSAHPAIAEFSGPGSVPQTREGTGFFIDKDGLLLTNFHVVDGAEVLKVITSERREYEAEVVGADALTDIALVRIKPDFKVVPVAIGDSDKIEVGQWVLAMGNPLGLEFFTAAGIVSGIGPPGPGYLGYYNFIQTDANIKPGNSGGPLVDYDGNVVGVNTAYLGPGSGIGFAIPINRVQKILPALKKDGRVIRGFMGLVAQPVSKGLAERLKLTGMAGAVISGVKADSPAGRAGLREGDVVVGYDGAPVKDDREFYEMINTSAPGSTASLDVERGGVRKQVKVTLGELRPKEILTQRVIRQCGLDLQEVDAHLAARLGLPGSGGLLVLKVVPGCPSFNAGLQFGDVIVKVEGRPVTTVADFYRMFSQVRTGDQVLIQIVRGGRPQLLTLSQVE